MQGNALIPLMGEPMNLARSVTGGAVAGNTLLRAAEERRNAPMVREQAQIDLQSSKSKLSADEAKEQLRRAAADTYGMAMALSSGDVNRAIRSAEQRRRDIVARGGDPSHTEGWIAQLNDPAQHPLLLQEWSEIQQANQLYGEDGGITDSRTNKMKELEAAGIKPGTPEYQQAVLGQTQTTKQRELAAAGIMPGSPEYRQAMLGGGSGGEGQKGSTDFVTVGGKSYTLGTVFNPQTQQWTNQLVPIEDPSGTGGNVEFLGSSGVAPSQRPEQKYRESQFGAAGEAAIKRSELYFDRVDLARRSISNIDEAIAAIRAGASTGTIMQYMPSFRESSKQLDAAGRRMGLDVVSAVTFGALSEKELEFAQADALPKDMEGPQLEDFLVQRRNAQLKLANYLESAAIYLGQTNGKGEPNTVASWYKMQKEGRDKGNGRAIGDIIQVGDKRYRITGLDDPNDPDVEEVQ